MQPQLHVGKTKPAPELMNPVDTIEYGMNKPNGGFWSSNYDPVTGYSAWAFAMIKAEGYDIKGLFDFRTTPRYVLEVEPSARILTVASAADWQAVRATYRMQKEYVEPALWPKHFQWVFKARKNIAALNFDKMALDYDALYLTQSGYSQTYNQQNGTFSWEAESTCWFRWCFSSVTDLGVGKLPFSEFSEAKKRVSGLSGH